LSERDVVSVGNDLTAIARFDEVKSIAIGYHAGLCGLGRLDPIARSCGRSRRRCGCPRNANTYHNQ
jgi:hypothetical protein